MADVPDTEPDSDFSESVFVDNLQIVDPAFLESKLVDTCMDVPGRLLGKSQFYIEIHDMHLNILLTLLRMDINLFL